MKRSKPPFYGQGNMGVRMCWSRNKGFAGISPILESHRKRGKKTIFCTHPCWGTSSIFGEWLKWMRNQRVKPNGFGLVQMEISRGLKLLRCSDLATWEEALAMEICRHLEALGHWMTLDGFLWMLFGCVGDLLERFLWTFWDIFGVLLYHPNCCAHILVCLTAFAYSSLYNWYTDPFFQLRWPSPTNLSSWSRCWADTGSWRMPQARLFRWGPRPTASWGNNPCWDLGSPSDTPRCVLWPLNWGPCMAALRYWFWNPSRWMASVFRLKSGDLVWPSRGKMPWCPSSSVRSEMVFSVLTYEAWTSAAVARAL